MRFPTLEKSKYIILLACLAFAALFVFSCGQDMVTSNSPADDVIVVENPVFITFPPKEGQPPLFATGSVTVPQNSLAAGGVVANGPVSVEFPPGAVADGEDVSVELLDEYYVIFDLGPEGLDFAQPVTLRLDLTGSSSEGKAQECQLLYFNDAEGRWELLPTVIVDPNTIEAQLEHFSKYGGGIGG